MCEFLARFILCAHVLQELPSADPTVADCAARARVCASPLSPAAARQSSLCGKPDADPEVSSTALNIAAWFPLAMYGSSFFMLAAQVCWLQVTDSPASVGTSGWYSGAM